MLAPSAPLGAMVGSKRATAGARRPSATNMITTLEHTVSNTKLELAGLQQLNERLRVRSQSLQVLARVLHEIMMYRQDMGVSCGQEIYDLQRLMGNSCLTSGMRTTSLSSSCSTAENNGGKEELGDLSPLCCGTAGADKLRGSGGSFTSRSSFGRPKSNKPEETLPHLAPGLSLLRLESVTTQEAEELREWNMSEFKQVWKGLIEDVRLQPPQEEQEPPVPKQEQGPALPRQSQEQEPQPLEEQPEDQPMEPNDEVEAASKLQVAGLRMQRLMALLALERSDAFIEFQTTLGTSQDAACGANDAPASHWESAIRSARLTKLQAHLMVDVIRLMHNRLAAIRSDRGKLMRSIEHALSAAGGFGAAAAASPMTSAAGSPDSPRGSPWGFLGSLGTWPAPQRALPPALLPASLGRPGTPSELGEAWREGAAKEEGGAGREKGPSDVVALQATLLEGLQQLEDSLGRERAVMVLYMQAVAALFTPEQLARMFASCWPYPPHLAQICSTLEFALKFQPDVWAPQS